MVAFLVDYHPELVTMSDLAHFSAEAVLEAEKVKRKQIFFVFHTSHTFFMCDIFYKKIKKIKKIMMSHSRKRDIKIKKNK